MEEIPVDLSLGGYVLCITFSISIFVVAPFSHRFTIFSLICDVGSKSWYNKQHGIFSPERRNNGKTQIFAILVYLKAQKMFIGVHFVKIRGIYQSSFSRSTSLSSLCHLSREIFWIHPFRKHRLELQGFPLEYFIGRQLSPNKLLECSGGQHRLFLVRGISGKLDFTASIEWDTLPNSTLSISTFN